MIAHIDADSFFASVLQRKHPHLKGKPLFAMGMGGSCVIAASYEAKAKGVKTGMPLGEALRLCPDAVRMPSDFRETALASQQIEHIVRDMGPDVEQHSIDEWFLDVKTLPGGIPAELEAWCRALQARVKNSTGLTVSIGAAPSKLLAKMAGEEHKPAGVTVLFKKDIKPFLGRRPAAAIPGIGRRREVHAKAHRWETAYDVATADRETIVRLLGKPGMDMQRELLGERLSGIAREEAPPKSVSRCRSFKPLTDEPLIWGHVLQHMSYVIHRMRRHELACMGVSVWLRDRSYRYQSAHASVPQPLDTEEELAPYVRQCFRSLYDAGNACTQVGLALWNLRPRAATQFSLFEEPKKLIEAQDLQTTLDAVRKRYGKESIHRGLSLAVSDHHKPAIGLPTFIEGGTR
jgi:nucleotidyltransferase/DNA polymerase involved in DNA repair